MSKALYEIVPINSGENKCVLAKEAAHLLKLGSRKNSKITLQWGSSSMELILELGNNMGLSQIGIDKNTMQRLGIPTGLKVKLIASDNENLRLGPLIGILTFSSIIPDKLHYYKVWAENNLNGGLLYVFRGKDIRLKEKRITGYYLNPATKSWEQLKLPFPDSVIDRCYPNNYNNQNKLEQVLGSGKIFNKNNMLTKIKFARTISRNPVLKKYLPETRIFRCPADLVYFLERYKQAFLKPSGAMKGSGIVVAVRDGHQVRCHYNKGSQKFCDILTSPNQIHGILAKAAGRKRNYIIQQPINSFKYEKGPLSFRVGVLKNAKGQWLSPGIVGLGTTGASFTTNYSAGGKAIPLSEVYDKATPALPYAKGDFIGMLQELSITAAKVLDEKHGPLGDLGIDLVVDCQGKPWLLEANGNSAKIAAFVQDEYPDWRTQTYQLPLSYAAYLAGFGN